MLELCRCPNIYGPDCICIKYILNASKSTLMKCQNMDYIIIQHNLCYDNIYAKMKHSDLNLD